MLRQKSGSKCSFTNGKLRFFAGFFLASSSLATFFNGLPGKKFDAAAIFLLLACAFFPAAAAAGEGQGGWRVEAGQMESSAGGVVTATGEVEMRPVKGDAVIRADRVVYDRKNARVEASGRVEVRQKDDRLTADYAEIDLDSGDIVLKNGLLYYDPAHLYVEAGDMKRIGGTLWRFRDLILSTCQFGPSSAPDWAFGAGRGRITVDGYAFLTHVTFRVRGVPVFYIPWLALPAKTTRQTGFLFPWISSSSRDGVAFAAPFFVNVSPSADFTLFPGYHEKRGPSFGLEARFRGAESAGLVALSYLDDRTAEENPATDGDYRSDGILRTRHDRWWLRGKLGSSLGRSADFVADIDAASDLDVILEFRDGADGFEKSVKQSLAMFNSSYQDPGLAMRENIAGAQGRGKYGFAGIQAVVVDDLEEEERPGEALHTLPHLSADLRLPALLPETTLALAADYHNYYRRQGSGYQRMYLRPELVAPFPWKLFEGRIALGADERLYRVEYHGDAAGESGGYERHGVSARANMAATFSRDYPGAGFRHGIRPNLVYSFQDADGRGEVMALDADDAMTDVNQAAWELNNYFWIAGKEGRGERLAARLKFSQKYDILEARRDDPATPRRPLGDLECDLELFPADRFYFRYQAALNMYGEHVTRTTVEGRYQKGDNRVSLNYAESSSARDLTASVKVRPWQRIVLAYETVESFLYDHKVRETASITYEPGCWGVALEASQDSGGRRLMLVVSLSGIGRGVRIFAD